MILTEIRFMDELGYETNKTLKGDRIQEILERTKIKKTKNKISVLSTYDNKNYETIREIHLARQ